ncbi:MAG: hypothetical protein HYW25_01105 [Candidatus Aenigmarchaeota archaeon]|nr:hypothetical protein [Candidatus Aenigmarchaeota archaeon]
MKSFDKALVAFIVIILVAGIIYGYNQYNSQKSDFASAEFGFGKWRLSNSGEDEVFISVEYSAQNPTERRITVQNFDVVLTFTNSTGSTLIKSLSLEPSQRIERTVQIPMTDVEAQNFLRFLEDGNVHISGFVHLNFLFLETRTPFDYDLESGRMIFA